MIYYRSRKTDSPIRTTVSAMAPLPRCLVASRVSVQGHKPACL